MTSISAGHESVVTTKVFKVIKHIRVFCDDPPHVAIADTL